MCYFCIIINILWLQIIEIKHISHIKKTTFLTTQPQSRSYRAVSKCHAAGRLMGDLQTLANIGKHRGMFANDVTCTHGGKTNDCRPRNLSDLYQGRGRSPLPLPVRCLTAHQLYVYDVLQ